MKDRDFKQDVYEALDELISSKINESIHTSAPGKIGNITDNFTAEVKPDLEVTTDDGEKIPYPNLSGAKVLMPCGAGGTIGFAFPVKSGDGCISLFSEGGTGSDLKFDLSNALLLPGLCGSSGEQTKRSGTEDAAIMYAPTATITVKKDCIELKKNGTTVKITDSSIDITGDVAVKGTVQVNGNVTISGTLTLGGIVMNSHTHAGVHGPTSGPQ